MLKKIIIYIVVFVLTGATSYLLHIFLLGKGNEHFITNLQKAYFFHFLFSLVLLIGFEITARSDTFFQQLGFIYMGLLVLKILVFTIGFYPELLGDNMLPRFYRASLLIPVIVFLSLEVFFISKIMQVKKP